MAVLSLTKTVSGMSGQIPARRVCYFGLAREKHCMNCGRMLFEDADLYTRRFCSLKCKEEYCSPIKNIVQQV